MTRPLLLFFFLLLSFPSYSQQDSVAAQEKSVAEEADADSPTLALLRKHDPAKAACWAIIPGGGQIYNRRWWKLPIVYTLLAASGSLIYYFANQTIIHRNEYFFRQYGATDYYNPSLSNRTTEAVLKGRDDNRRFMELSIGAFAICYTLSIIDAVVDAHLFYFDISDDLSLRLSPSMRNYSQFHRGGLTQAFSTGFSLQFTF